MSASGNRQDRRRVDEDQFVSPAQLSNQHREVPPLEDAAGILNGCAGGQQVEGTPLHGNNNVFDLGAFEHVAQARALGDIQEPAKGRSPQIGVDKQGGNPGVATSCCQLSGQRCFAFSADSAGHEHTTAQVAALLVAADREPQVIKALDEPVDLVVDHRSTQLAGCPGRWQWR